MGEQPEPESKLLQIKKYANRRYYDSAHSRHLTLEEIWGLVKEGHDLHVTEAKTGSDITAQVLAQIILELDTPKLDALPAPLLAWLIRMNDDGVKDFVGKCFTQALKPFFDYQQQLEQQGGKSHILPTVLPVIAEWTKALVAPLKPAFPAAAEKKEPATVSATAHSSEDLGELLSEVEHLKAESSKKNRKAKA